MYFESFQDHVNYMWETGGRDYKTNTSLLFLKNSTDIHISAFTSKPERMNNEKKEDLREKKKTFLFLNLQYIVKNIKF